MSKYNYTSCIFISLLTILVLATIIIRGMEPLNDGDIWFHLAYGRYLLENHTLIPDHSVFSWTPAENGTIYCAWLSEIIFYLLYETGGLTILYTFRYLVIIIFLVLAFSLLKKNLIEHSPVILLILLTGILMSYAGLRIKAELFSFLFMTIVVWCWFTIKSRPENNWYLLYIFPVIFLLWVNSHGGFVFGLVFMTLIAAGEVLNFITGSPSMFMPEYRKHLFISFCMCFISIFLTPYGFHYPVQLVNNLILNPEEFSLHIKTIAEYQSIFFPRASYLHFIDYLLAAVTILFICLALQIKRQKPYWEILLINAGFILLYVKYLRVTYFWGILFVFSSIFLLNKIPQDSMKALNNKLIRYVAYSIAGMVLIFFAIRNQYQILTMPSMGIHQDYIIPFSEAGYIRDTYPDNIVGNDYYSGSYLIWSLWPRKKVFIDARYFPYRRWYLENNEFEINTDKKYNDLFLKKYQSNIWIISHDTPVLYYFISSPEWRLAYYGSSACVFISRGVRFHQQKHFVSDSVYKTGIYQAYKILRLAVSVGDLDTAVRIVRTMQPNPISVLQENIAMNAMLFVGSRLSEAGRHRDAIKLYAGALEIPNRYRWLKMFPSRKDNKYLPLLHDNLGYSLMKVNRIPEAVTEYNYALKLNPSAAYAKRYLPLLTEQLKKIDMVLEKLKADLINSPNDLKLLNTVAMLSAMTGRYDEAQVFLLREMKINPNDPNIYYNLACLYSKQKRTNDSVNYLKQAVSKGFKDWNTLHNDPDLDNIRNTNYFNELESYH